MKATNGKATDVCLQSVVTGAAAFVAEFVQDAATVYLIMASADGTIRAWNAAAASCFGSGQSDPAGATLGDRLSAADQAELQRHFDKPAGSSGERFVLTVRDAAGAARNVVCRLDRRPDGVLLIGENFGRPHEAGLADLAQINNELADIMRESVRKEQALARALRDLAQKNEALERANERIAELARRDPLTGLFNRRHFDEALATEAVRARRQGAALTAVMIDLDHFKSVNDRYGHGVGDAVLVAAAAAVAAQCRPYDILARYGGEEFVLLLPATTLEGGVRCAERLRSAVAALKVESYPHPVTASLGVATLATGEDGDALLRRADECLYRAKQAGRNRVEADIPAFG